MSATREHLSAVDAAWYRMDERGDPADIGSVMIFDGPLDEARMRETLQRRIAPHRRFHQRVVDPKHHLTSPSWEDEPDFSFDAHIETRRLAEPTDAALRAVVSQLMSAPLGFDRSPWRVAIIHGVDGGFALFARVHHCMGDGFALLHILLELTDPSPDPDPATASPSIAEHEDRSWLAEAARIARDLPADAAALGHLLLVPFDPKTPLHGKLSGRRCLAWSAPVPLERVKKIAKACGGTINDVLVGAMAGALRRWFEDQHSAPVGVRAVVPVNLRPPNVPFDDVHGNWFGLVFLDLPTGTADRATRVAAVQREMNRIKKSKEAIVALGLLAAIGRSPAVVDHIVDDLFARKASLVITNVPGPRHSLRLDGQRMRDMWFWAPHPCGLGCGASILSYAGNVRVGIRSDAAIMSNPDAVARWFVEELEAVERDSEDVLHRQDVAPPTS